MTDKAATTYPNVKFVYPKCDLCPRVIHPKQAIRFVWKKRNADLTLCPPCFQKLHDKHLKELKVTKEAMAKSGYLEQGAKEVDFKSYLEKWAKKLKQTL